MSTSGVGLTDHGGPLRTDPDVVPGRGVGPIVLLHGLMGRGRTWRRQVPWLRRYGRVFTLDAAFHTGAPDAVGQADSVDPADLADVSTERFVADIAEVLTRIDQGPAVLVGHSMGGLHAWCTAAAYPELVSALVIEDMAPDFRGLSTGDWTPWVESWPERFGSRAEIDEMVGALAGRYFDEAFDDGRLHGRVDRWAAIADEWTYRDFWTQWEQVADVGIPALLLEAEHGVTPPGQMATMRERHSRALHHRIAGAGHLAHDDRPAEFRGALEAFLSGLSVG